MLMPRVGTARSAGMLPALSIVVILVWVSIASAHGLSSAGAAEARYVGSEACKGCHLKEYDNYMKFSGKAKSFESVQKMNRDLTGQEIEKCYSCHTTGYGRAGGFVSAEKTPHLKNAGCEVCHGPGSIHVKTGNPRHIRGKIGTDGCKTCHIAERIKAFRYKSVIHEGAH